MDSLNTEGILTFTVEAEAEGFSAHACVASYSMVTQGADLDELREMIGQLVDDYNQHEAGGIRAFALQFTANKVPLAA